MIDAKLVTARRDRVDLLPTTLHLDAGRHALLGRKEDGVSVLLACMAGEVRARRGTLTVLDGSPFAPKTRARVGWIPLGVGLPDVLRVDETIATARRIRGDDALAASTVLAPLGIESLASRRIDSLGDGETRAVALAEALASKIVTVLLIEEPFVAMAPSAVAAMPKLLAARANTCVVVSTASAHDASRVAHDFALFDHGRLVRIVTEPPLRTRHDSPLLHVVVSDARALAASLAKHAVVERLELSARGVIVSGPDENALAAAVNAAIIDANVDVFRIEPDRATFEALHADAVAELAPQPRPASPPPSGAAP